MGRKLFVGNLPFQTAESDLQELFSQHGDVDTVRVMRDMATGRARGFAFVEMVTEEAAAAAATSLDGTQFNGRAIAVNEARPKPAFGGRSDDRGFGGGNSRRRSEPRW
ncbi:MAG: RNA recognition motif domain-containing protein [Vicinamibacterales bacterium]